MLISEAKTKVCPFMSHQSKILCITNECMAWEYTITHQTHWEQREKELMTIIGKEKDESEKEGICKRLLR